jgi:hypothetical protein
VKQSFNNETQLFAVLKNLSGGGRIAPVSPSGGKSFEVGGVLEGKRGGSPVIPRKGDGG